MESKETINIGDICVYDPLAKTTYRKQSNLDILYPEFIMLIVDRADKKYHYTCLDSSGEIVILHFEYLTKIFSRLD